MKRFFLIALVGLLTLPTLAMGDVITQWDFNDIGDNSSATGTLVPNAGTGSIGLIGNTTATFAGGTLNPSQSSDPFQGADNSAWNVTTFSSGVEFTDGIEVFVSTAGFFDISVNWDQRFSNTSSRFAAFLYTLDNGATWTQATGSMLTAGAISGTANPGGFDLVSGDLFEAGSGDRFHNGRTVDLSGILGANDNAFFGFRIVSAFDPNTGNFAPANSNNPNFATNGTWRFDMVTVNGTAIPEPAAVSLLGLLSLALVVFRRRR